MTATAKVITKTKKYENRDRENLNGDLQMELDRALADSFPASDPPATTPTIVGPVSSQSEGEPATEKGRTRPERAEAEKR